MKIKFNLDNELPLDKTIEIATMTIVVRAIFLKNNKYSQMNVCIKFKIQKRRVNMN